MLFARALAAWFVILLLAILNGAMRDWAISPRFGDQAGHIISTVILCTLIFLLAWLTILWIAPATLAQAFAVGVFWLVLTVAFEFLAGHYLFGQPWEKLLADYNILQGRVWVLVLLATLLAPVWAYYIRGV